MTGKYRAIGYGFLFIQGIGAKCKYVDPALKRTPGKRQEQFYSHLIVKLFQMILNHILRYSSDLHERQQI